MPLAGCWIIVTPEIAGMIRTESSVAVQHWLGVSRTWVTSRRGALKVPRLNKGTRNHFKEQCGRILPYSFAHSLKHRYQKPRGSRAHPNTIDALCQASRRPKSQRTRERQRAAAHRRFDASKPEKLYAIEQLARENGGDLLSSEYLGVDHKLRFSCSRGHEFELTPHSVKRGAWCIQCRREHRRRVALHQMRELAIERHGRLLSEEYINSSTPLLWECHQGHRWTARPEDIKKGTWCPVCIGRRGRHRISATTSPTFDKMDEDRNG